MWKEKLGNYLIDISKYVLTGVVIASMFRDLHDKTILYVVGFTIAIAALMAGLLLIYFEHKKK